ncbi:MAG: ABC-type iron(III) dicitrate-transport system component, TonB-dependent outer rane receptor FecA [Bacteroidota bacterium]
MKYIYVLALLLSSLSNYSQNKAEKDSVQNLKTVFIFTENKSIRRMAEVENNILNAGKKNEVLDIAATSANLATNNAREAFAKIPGLSIWENDASGIQINIGVRGLSPNRSWELNTRQNGYDISSDVFGYPEAYYNPPLNAVSELQFIRGGASLQFGPQFGGTVNYVLKRETQKLFSFETQNTVGSYGLLNSYNAIGGKLKKFSYYAYHDARVGNGWRKNSRYDAQNSHLFLEYRFTENTKLSAEYTNMNYSMQQPGGVTDAQFDANASQSSRSRNWFGAPWQLFSINFDTRFSKKLNFNAKVFGLLGERNSVGFVAPITIADAINPTTLNFANRQVDRDFYKNIGLETRSIYSYDLLGTKNNNLAFGTRFYKATTSRQQQATGTNGNDFDLTTAANFPRDMYYTTKNVALFAENQFKANEKFSITPGVRYEHIASTVGGQFGISNGNPVAAPNNNISRNRVLFGLGLEYKFKKTNLYANISQAFRPVLFSDTTPPATTDVIDPNLSDASGFNFDFGFRGNAFNALTFDVSYFYLNYENRIGTIRRFLNDNPSQNTFQFRTNLGTSVHQGFEGFAELNVNKALKIDDQKSRFSVFASVSLIEALYTDFPITSISGNAPNTIIATTNLKGKRVENAPRYIHNFGVTYRFRNFSATIQNRMQGMIFTDANNTETPSANAVVGAISGFSVADLSLNYKFFEKYTVRAGANNFANTKYATRRAGGYPGPGLMPGDARTFYVSIGAKF